MSKGALGSAAGVLVNPLFGLNKPVVDKGAEVAVKALTPDMPSVETPEELPTPENASGAMDAAAAQQRRARSRTATILTGANTPQGAGSISRRTLLGS